MEDWLGPTVREMVSYEHKCRGWMFESPDAVMRIDPVLYSDRNVRWVEDIFPFRSREVLMKAINGKPEALRPSGSEAVQAQIPDPRSKS